MSFLDNGKKIAALEKELAETVAKVGTATALAESRLVDLNSLTEKLTLFEASSSKAVADLDAKLTAAEVALTSEKTAHEATKASVDAQAAIKAQTILSQAGQPPVKASSAFAEDETLDGLREKINSMPIGAKGRAALVNKAFQLSVKQN